MAEDETAGSAKPMGRIDPNLVWTNKEFVKGVIEREIKRLDVNVDSKKYTRVWLGDDVSNTTPFVDLSIIKNNSAGGEPLIVMGGSSFLPKESLGDQYYQSKTKDLVNTLTDHYLESVTPGRAKSTPPPPASEKYEFDPSTVGNVPKTSVSAPAAENKGPGVRRP